MPNSNLNMGTILFPNQPAPFIITDQQARSDIQSLKTQLDQKATAINNSASGSLVSVDDASSVPAVQLITHIEPVQAGSGDPSPTNVRPISGWNSVKVHRTNDNLLGGDYLADMLVESTSAVKDADAGTVTFAANKASGFEWHGPFKPNTQYTVVLYGKNTNGAAREANFRILYTDGTRDLVWFDTAGDYSYAYLQSDTGRGNTTRPNNTVSYIAGWYSTDSTELVYNKCGIFEGVIDESTFGDLVVCDGQTLTADLPETVYGGLINWKEGKILSDWRFVDLGEYEWTARGNGIFWARITAANDYPGMNMVCTAYKTSTASNPEQMEDNSVWSKFFAFNNQNVIVKDTRFTTGAEFKSALSGVMLAFKTQTATEYQMTPQQLDMLKGANNVWSDSGDTSVVYVADTKLYIDNKLAAISAAMLNL